VRSELDSRQAVTLSMRAMLPAMVVVLNLASWLVLLAVTVISLSACGGAQRTPEPAPAAATAPLAPAATGSAPVELREEGRPTDDAGSTVFMWRAKANDMQLFVGDAPDLCRTLSAGALPSGATLLTATLKLAARDVAFGAGEYPIRQGDAAPSRYTKRATLMKLDASCQPLERKNATSGVIRLSTPEVHPDSALHGELELELEGEMLSREFSASFCPTPEQEPNGCR
jgi:hypothetical protein